MTDPHRVAQDEELESLRAIYGDDWRDIAPKKTAWGTEVDEGWWEIRLRGRDDPRVEVLLRGKMGKMYPKQPPQLSLAEPKNLTGDHIKVLTRKLQDEAKQLAANKQEYYISIDWMDKNHMTLPKPGEIEPNLLELKEQREQAQQAVDRAQREAEEEQRRAQAEEEQRLLTEKIHLDASRKSERARQLIAEEETRRAQETMAGLRDGELASRSITLAQPIAVQGFAGSWTTWTLFGGTRETLWTTYTAEPDPSVSASTIALSFNSLGTASSSSFVTLNMPILAVQVIDFSSAQYGSAHWQRKLDSLATEIQRVQGVASPHLLRVYAIHRTTSPRGWQRLMIFTEKVKEGGRLRGWLPTVGLGEEAARQYMEQILEGLADLHRSGHTHRQLDLDLILTSSAGPAQKAEIKLSGSSYARRIIDYHRSERFLRGYHDTVPEAWKSPDEVDQPQTYTRARDMWHAGLVFLQIMFGEGCLHVYPNPEVFLQSGVELSEGVRELLAGLLHPFNKKRISAEEALQILRRKDEENKGQIARKPFARTNSASQGALQAPNSLFGTSPQARHVSFVRTGASASSFRRDWEELEFLGKGGFGEVVKARNKADGAVYAVKKVRLRAGDNEQRFRREASYLASLKQHPHIVRYHYCWIETIEPTDPPPTAVDSSASETPSATTDGDSDFFKDPLKLNFDTSFKDVSKSASFPRIRFVADDADSEDDTDMSSSSEESEEEIEEETTPNPSQIQPAQPLGIKPKPSVSFTDSTQESDITSILYISMEFLENETLREAIGPNLTQDEAWKYLKQVSQALAHLAAHKVVHRDLKPSNILLDSVLDAKIADFGLSTTGIGNEALLTSHTHSKDLDHTSNIGTGLYIAPEVAVSNDYDEKADMYSLGIIFFEMCYPFATQMERANIIGALRRPEIAFPSEWPENRGAEKEIIKWLLQHDPKLRPSAAELLQSPLIPKPEREQQYTDDAIVTLTDSNSSYYPKLIKSLFRSSANAYPSYTDNRHHDYTFDNDHDDGLQPWLTLVTKRLVELFERHGAVQTYLPLLLPETNLLSAFPSIDVRPAKLLDESGKLTRLPNSGLLAMARSATRKQIERIKRYHVGMQYAEHQPEGQPTAIGELWFVSSAPTALADNSFDIVSPLRSSAAEAELLEVVDKMLSEFKGERATSSADYEFHISHEAILAKIVALAPEKQRGPVLQVLKSLSSAVGSREVKDRLQKVSLPKTVMEDLVNCCFVDELPNARRKLEAVFASGPDHRRLQMAFEEMSGIVKLAMACGIKRKIVFRSTLSRHAEVSLPHVRSCCADSRFFRGGFMFECVRRSKQRDEVVAFGGRYDCLLEHFKDPATQMPSRRVYGVGVSIAVENLARMVQKQESQASEKLMRKEKDNEKSFGFWTPARCDVYVAAGQGVDLSYRLALTKDLWRAGISADLQYDDGRAFDEVKTECLEQNTLFMVLPKPNRQDMEIKVFHVLRNTDEEVPRNALASNLQNAIAEQRRIDASYASSEGSIPLALAAPVPGAPAVEGRVSDEMVVLVLPPEPQSAKGTKGRPVRKFRHQTKNVYREKATEFVTSMRTSLVTIGVDLDLPLLQKLTLEGSWIWNDEKWKALILDKTTADRKYADEVREAVQKAVRGESGLANGQVEALGSSQSGAASTAGKREVRLWLFSVRENRGFLLQVQK